MNHIEYLFNNFTKKPNWLNIDSPQISRYDLIIGWDSEYQQISAIHNGVISYQFAAYFLRRDRYQEGIFYLVDQSFQLKYDSRLSLAEFLKKVIRKLELI